MPGQPARHCPRAASQAAKESPARGAAHGICPLQPRQAAAAPPSRGLLASLWEFPGQDGHLSLEQAAETLAQAGIQVSSIASLGEHTHIFSHVEWPMVCYQVECLPFPAAEDYVWCTPQQLQEQYALPSAFRPFAQWLRLTP